MGCVVYLIIVALAWSAIFFATHAHLAPTGEFTAPAGGAGVRPACTDPNVLPAQRRGLPGLVGPPALDGARRADGTGVRMPGTDLGDPPPWWRCLTVGVVPPAGDRAIRANAAGVQVASAHLHELARRGLRLATIKSSVPAASRRATCSPAVDGIVQGNATRVLATGAHLLEP